ncbi:hypothetical protein F3Y22_tig00013386pilonHSYRG00073 [Hibiscus syriacus]|uniref:C3H1-type domain-containing protein n=1 Tax=Hibiscus syriacus TaxID=106335 RepID=A0A6A3C185_HIBSY|nr:hypothetical protein F3Y22_tig00013386pilonHSYRG00073 [Hibiscus syriacus]
MSYSFLHRKSFSVPGMCFGGSDDVNSEFARKSCSYFARGFCKNGSSCRYGADLGYCADRFNVKQPFKKLSGQVRLKPFKAWSIPTPNGDSADDGAALVGSPSKLSELEQYQELLRSKALQASQFIAGASSLPYNKLLIDKERLMGKKPKKPSNFKWQRPRFHQQEKKHTNNNLSLRLLEREEQQQKHEEEEEEVEQRPQAKTEAEASSTFMGSMKKGLGQSVAPKEPPTRRTRRKKQTQKEQLKFRQRNDFPPGDGVVISKEENLHSTAGSVTQLSNPFSAADGMIYDPSFLQEGVALVGLQSNMGGYLPCSSNYFCLTQS